MNDEFTSRNVKAVERPLRVNQGFHPELLEVDWLVRSSEARATFHCDGSRTTVAVLDTGLNSSHLDFAGRIVAQSNFTQDNGGDPHNADDGNGHGTHVTGIVSANAIHKGIAPGTRIVAVKVLANDGSGTWGSVYEGLQWVIQNRLVYGISAVCMSLGDGGNHKSASQPADGIGSALRDLDEVGVVCCVAAGNDFFSHQSQQGMGYPAIFPTCVSVGAVFDGNVGPLSYVDGAVAYSTSADRITPFSQRLHADEGGEFGTDIFAPGAPVTSTGFGEDGSTVQAGTSQATPVVAGVALLLQSYYLRATNSLPSTEQIRQWLMLGAAPIMDGDDENDNVKNTNKVFARVDAYAALAACARRNAASLLVQRGIGLR